MKSRISRRIRAAMLAGAVSVVATGCAIPLFDEYPERISSRTIAVSPSGKVRIEQTDWRHPSGTTYSEFTGINGHDVPFCMQVFTTPRYYREYWERDFTVPVPPGASVKLYEYDHRGRVDVMRFGWAPRPDGVCYEQDRPPAS
jgi:hypothetical protein